MNIPTMEELLNNSYNSLPFDIHAAFYHGYMAALNEVNGYDRILADPWIVGHLNLLRDTARADLESALAGVQP